MRVLSVSLLTAAALLAQAPHPIPNGYSLPNGWRITPLGKAIPTEDLILNLTASLDEKIVSHSTAASIHMAYL
jgi:hypothetical protein